MVKKLGLTLLLLDKHRIFRLKAKYDSETRLAETKRRLTERMVQRFEVDPDHIYLEKKGLRLLNVVFIDNAQLKSMKIKTPVKIEDATGTKIETKEIEVPVGQSVKMHTDDPIDQKKSTLLGVLTEKSFWKALIEKRKLPLSTMLILLGAGMGLYHLFVLILRALGASV
jgi:2-methylcitrate dehydratase PrpD